MSTFLRCCGDQMPVMFCDIQAAESAVDDGLAILRLWPSELNWSVAQLNVDVPGSFPFVQNEGSDPSNPPTVLTVAGWPNAPIAVNKTSKREEHTPELQSRLHLVCRLLLEKKKPPRADAPRPHASTTKSSSACTPQHT